VTFDTLDIRRGMDVFTLDGVYIGWVLLIRAARKHHRPAEVASSHSERGSAVGGESIGPMPTAEIGNRGPRTQSARAGYATTPDARSLPLGRGEIIVLRTPIGLDVQHPLPRLRRIPLNAIQTVSLERITLRTTSTQLDARA